MMIFGTPITPYFCARAGNSWASMTSARIMSLSTASLCADCCGCWAVWACEGDEDLDVDGVFDFFDYVFGFCGKVGCALETPSMASISVCNS